MKTIAVDPETDRQSSATSTPSLTANKAKLPQVANDFTAKDIAITRGLADSFALRLSNHSDQVHTRYRPEGKNARAVFEAVEQARIEALGANAMPGMAEQSFGHAGRPLSQEGRLPLHRPQGCAARRGRGADRAREA